jgi:acetyltransferase-like isoleucine patch superfamily enzyme
LDKDKVRARYIHPSAWLVGDDLEVGEGTWIGAFVLLDGSYGLKIGRDCDISSGAKILTHSTHMRCTEQGEKLTGRVEIGDHVFIGTNSVILHDVVVGHHSIIGALTLIESGSRIHPYSKVVGVPGRIV